MIELSSVTKRFGNVLAVDHLSMVVPDATIMGFLGPNGAGKTTTMRMIAGLIQPDEGEITVAGASLSAEPARAKSLLGFVPDRPYLYEKLTASEFMEFFSEMYGMEPAAASRRILDLLSMFGLWDRRNELVESYSHGMKQRLVMAAALLHQPEVLVIDEPMVGLDPRGAKLVKKLFKDLAEKDRVTILLSTHTLQVAEEVCHRVAIIHHGRLVAEGTLDYLRERARLERGRLEEVFLKLTEEQY